MNKLKKVISSIGIFIIGMVSKVYAGATSIEPLYGLEPGPVPKQAIGEKFSGIGKIVLPLVLFIIGLFVVLNKRITQKVKIITISTLLTIGVLGWVVLNYIANNY
jgi:hypothetical protein